MPCTAQLSPSRTYEGDTYVLSQQIGNAVVKHWNKYVCSSETVRPLTSSRESESSISALSYLGRLRNSDKSSLSFEIASTNAWTEHRIQEDVLELRAAILAERHLSDVAAGKDTSYDVFELTMAHADLTYCRALQAQVEHVAVEHKETLKILTIVVCIAGSMHHSFAKFDIVRSHGYH